jgi:hypothetical protein
MSTLDRLKFQTDLQTGLTAVPNMLPGQYRGEFQGLWARTTNWFTIPDTNGVCWASNCVASTKLIGGLPWGVAIANLDSSGTNISFYGEDADSPAISVYDPEEGDPKWTWTPNALLGFDGTAQTITLSTSGDLGLAGSIQASGTITATNGFYHPQVGASPTANAIGGTVGSVTNHLLLNRNGTLTDYWSDGASLWSKQIAP